MQRCQTWAVVSCAVVAAALVTPVVGDAGDVVVPGGVVLDMVADPAQNALYASIATANEIVKVSFDTASVTARVTVPEAIELLAIAPDGSRLYVTLRYNYEVLVYDLPGLTYLLTYDLSVYSHITGIVAGSTRLYVYAGGSISIVDLATDAEIFWGSLHPSHDVDDLILNPDETKAFSVNYGQPNRVWMHDIADDIPIHVGNDCYGCLGRNGDDADISPDGSLLYIAGSDPQDFVQVNAVPEAGHFVEKHSILTGYHPVAVATSADGALAYVGIWGDDHMVAAVRTSDWLPFRLESLVHFVHEESFVVSTNGTAIAAVADGPYPNRIEIVDFSGLPPNRGGVRLRPVDGSEGVPVGNAEIVGAPFRSGSGWLDFPAGILGHAPLEAGQHTFDLEAAGYASQTIQVTITPGSWTDLGEIQMTRAGDFPDPDRLCASPAAPSGATSTVQFHGRDFHPAATLTSENIDVTIDDFTWVNWSTIDATVTVDAGTPTGSRSDLRVSNPGGGFDYGYLFVLEPGESSPGFRNAAVVTDESAATVDIEVIRTGSAEGMVSVDWITSDSSATAGQDYAANSGTLTWLDGESLPQTITLAIYQDVEVEGSETFTVDLSNVVGGELGAITQSTMTIIDDDASYLQFSASSYADDEDGGSVQVTVTRTVNTDVAASVDYTTSNGTATEPGDYTLTAGTLSWVDGDSSPQAIDVPVFDDGDAEGNETLTVTLSNPSADAVLGDPSEAGLTIIDNDGSVLTLSTDTIDVNERDGSATVSVLRTNSVSGAVTVNYATSDGTATDGQDYTAASGTLNWADGEGGAMSFSIPLIEDGLMEPDETVTIDLSSPTGPSAIGVPGSAVLTIADNDGTGFQFSSDSFQASETDGSVEITVQRVGNTTGVATIQYATGAGSATAGADYEHVAGTLSWAGGDGTDKAFAVNLIDDAVTEFIETVSLELSNPTGNASLGDPATATLNIEDDESIETRINTIAEYAQMRPRVATGATGAAVVVWDSWRQDGWGWGVYGQRLNAAGDPVGGEIHVSVTTDEDQMTPAVAAAADGSFVVVWQGDVASGTAIFARRYDSSGTPLGGESVVNSSTSGNQTVPRVAFDGNGRSMVVWQGRDASGAGVFARVFGADGAPLADEFAVNTTTPLSQDLPAVAGSSVGGFVVVWESYTQDDGLSDGVIGRRFGSTGAALGGEILVNDSVAGDQELPAVAAAGDGRFIVVWEDDAGIDGSLGSIQGRWFDGVGSPIGGDFQINVYTVGDQGRPVVAAEPDGRTVVVWEGRGGQDGSEIGVYQRILLDNGTFAGDEIQLNTYISQSQYQPAVACSSVGGAFGVWTSEGQDGSVEGVYGVSWPLPPTRLIFADDFESGDTTAW